MTVARTIESLAPAEVPAGTTAFADMTGQWLVLRTRSRQEKAVVRYLDSIGATNYLPLVPRTSIIRGRKHVSRVPLFPGYVFMAGTRELAFPAVTAKRVCQILPIHEQDTFVEQIESVRLAIDADGLGIELYPHAVVGRRCRVLAGPFEGTEGTITERLGPCRLVLSIDILGQGAALEIDADLLEPFD